MIVLTESQQICLRYLDDKMEATVRMVGESVLAARKGKGGSNCLMVGAAVLRWLRKRGLVTYLSDLSAWRITPSGREALRATEYQNGQPLDNTTAK